MLDIRGAFRTLSNIYDGAFFCKNSRRLLAIFARNLYHRSLVGYSLLEEWRYIELESIEDMFLKANRPNRPSRPNCSKPSIRKVNKLYFFGTKPILVQYSISISPENVKKQRFADVFSRYRNGTLGSNGLSGNCRN